MSNTEFGEARSWLEDQEELALLASKQLFFIGGAPRSGTTWVTEILDAHPDICCRGEGLLQRTLAEPLAAMLKQHASAVQAKNTRLFAHNGGYPLPDEEEAEILLGTAVLLALRRQGRAGECLAIGEKTPENVFLFPRLKRLFPRAKCIAVARDPRDVLTSAWHFFHEPVAGEDPTAAKAAFIRQALPSLNHGARTIIELGNRYPDDVMTVTYESLRQTPEPVVSALCRFLHVSDDPSTVASCLRRASFASLSGGRKAGNEQPRAFFRKGVVGDWTLALTPMMNEMVLAELGWMFPHFGWKP